jgi:hypothetical protein
LYFVFACVWAFGGVMFQDQVIISLLFLQFWYFYLPFVQGYFLLYIVYSKIPIDLRLLVSIQLCTYLLKKVYRLILCKLTNLLKSIY